MKSNRGQEVFYIKNRDLKKFEIIFIKKKSSLF